MCTLHQVCECIVPLHQSIDCRRVFFFDGISKLITYPHQFPRCPASQQPGHSAIEPVFHIFFIHIRFRTDELFVELARILAQSLNDFMSIVKIFKCRMMDFCQQLVARFGRPIVSTSANISGEATPKKFSEISEDIKNAVDYIVDPSLEKGSTGRSSSIIKVGLDYSIEIIRG